jgi:hypothetical protein
MAVSTSNEWTNPVVEKAASARSRLQSRPFRPRSTGAAPRPWGKLALGNLIYWNEVDKGAQFAAWEQPKTLRRRGARRIQLIALIGARWRRVRGMRRARPLSTLTEGVLHV